MIVHDSVQEWRCPIQTSVMFQNITYLVKTGEVLLTMPLSGNRKSIVRAGEGSFSLWVALGPWR